MLLFTAPTAYSLPVALVPIRCTRYSANCLILLLSAPFCSDKPQPILNHGRTFVVQSGRLTVAHTSTQFLSIAVGRTYSQYYTLCRTICHNIWAFFWATDGYFWLFLATTLVDRHSAAPIYTWPHLVHSDIRLFTVPTVFSLPVVLVRVHSAPYSAICLILSHFVTFDYYFLRPGGLHSYSITVERSSYSRAGFC